MTTRAERKAENRAKLLAAARQVFAEKGLGAATVRDVVRQTDLATGTFYNYFTGKDDVFRAVLEEFGARARALAREERLEPGRSLEDRIAEAYRAYFELLLADRETFAVIRQNAATLAVMEDAPGFDSGASEMLEDFRRWLDEGLLPAELEELLPLLAAAMLGTGFQIAALAAGAEELDPETAACFCARLFCQGISGFR